MRFTRAALDGKEPWPEFTDGEGKALDETEAWLMREAMTYWYRYEQSEAERKLQEAEERAQELAEARERASEAGREALNRARDGGII